MVGAQPGGCFVAPGSIGVLSGCFGGTNDGDSTGLPGGLLICQGHLLTLKGHLCQVGVLVQLAEISNFCFKELEAIGVLFR